MTDPILDPEARRLFVSGALSTHAARQLRGRIVPEGDADLLGLALRLGEVASDFETRYRLSFEPPYPGVTAGVESVRGGIRLLLACRALGDDGVPLGVVFTALIAGRAPQVSVAPPGAPIPEEWRKPGD